MAPAAADPTPSTLIGQQSSVLLSIPRVESGLLTLPWRANVLVRAAYARTRSGSDPEQLVMPNALVRLYSRGPSGIRVEAGRGRINASDRVYGKVPLPNSGGANALGPGQPVIATRVPSGGEALELTWVYDGLSGYSAGNVKAQFDISGWGIEASPGLTDDATPPESTTTFTWTGVSSAQVAPFAWTYGNGEPSDSYLIEGLFANAGASDAYLYLLDGDANGIALAPIRIAAGDTASYTPRRPLHFLNSMHWVARTSANGPASGVAAPITATLTWV